MSTNPYATPKAQVADQTVVNLGTFVRGGRGVAASRGWEWLAEGWRLFKGEPWTWIAIVIVFFVIFLVLAFIPFIGALAQFVLTPVLTGGVMLGCHAIDQDGDLTIGHLFAGFGERFGKLAAVGALYLAGWIAIFLIAMVVTGASMLPLLGGGATDILAVAAGAALGFLVMMALAMPLVMAVWFAPALAVFHDLSAVEAMKQSFAGCLRNIVPFLVYGVIGLVLGIVASIPIGLGWLVLVPVIFGSIYAAYRDVYFLS